MSLSDEALAREVEAASTEGLQLRPDTQVVRRDGWLQLLTPSSGEPWLNGVVRSVLSDAEAPQVVARTVAEYRALGKPMRWCVGPSTRPVGLPALLLAQGLRRASDSVGMAAEVSALALPQSPGVEVEEVEAAGAARFIDVFCAGWSVEGARRAELEADARRELSDSARRVRYFVASVDGTPVGAGTLKLLPRSGYLMGSVVLPSHRGRGVYRALVAARVALLRTLGVPLATIEASRVTAAPICARLGFRAVCETSRYEG